MAATNYTPISLYYSSTASATPSAGNLVNGELAINITDGKLFYKDNSGTVKVLAGTGGTGIVAGSNTQVQFNNGGVFGASANFTWDGTSLTASNYVSTGNITINTNKFTVDGSTGNTLISGNATVGTLTNTRVVYAGASGLLSDSTNLTFDGTTLTAGGFTTTGTTSTGVLSVTGNTTLGNATADTVTVNGTITSNLIFTDNTYDIGASSATRPRNLYLAGAATFGTALDTASGGTGLSSYTAGDLSYYASGTSLTKLAIGTSGQILTSTGTAPQWSTLSGVAVTTFSAGTTGFTPSSATSGAVTLSGTLITSNGGTGLSSYTAGDLVYYSTGTALSKLAIGTANYVMTSSGSAPQWSQNLSIGSLTASSDSSFTSTGALTISKGTTAQQPGTPATGMMRYNTSTNQFEGYSGASPAWKSIGGSALSNDTSSTSSLYPVFASATTGTAENLYTSNSKYLYKPSTGELKVSAPVATNGIFVNADSVAADYTIATGTNGFSVGPVTVASGVTVTVSSGQQWIVI